MTVIILNLIISWLLPKSDVYLGGNMGDGTGSTQALVLYNGTNSFVTLLPMNVKRQHHRCAYDSNTNRIYVVGGQLSNGTTITSAEYYSIGTNSWSVISSSDDRVGFGLVATNDGFLYAFGGKTSAGLFSQGIRRYNISNDSWGSTPVLLNNQSSYFGTIRIFFKKRQRTNYCHQVIGSTKPLT